MKFRTFLKLKRCEQKELAKRTGLNEPLISNFTRYKCLPTPKDLDKICKALDCEILDLYDKDEILFIKPKKKRTKEQMDCYKLTVTLSPMFRDYFDIKNLERLGFTSVKDCVMKMVAKPLMTMSIKRVINEVNKKRSELVGETTNSDKVVS